MSSCGSFTCVGTGISLGAHLTKEVELTLIKAEQVFVLVTDPVYEAWLATMCKKVVSLQSYYQEGKSRRITYQEMSTMFIELAKSGQDVVVAFYGHPGVFVTPSHKAIKALKALNIPAKMLPGISAADCLFADLSINPGAVGCQHFEAQQWLTYKHKTNTSAYMVLWQVMMAGDITLTQQKHSADKLSPLLDKLTEHYPDTHNVTIYEASRHAATKNRQDVIELWKLPQTELTQFSTLVIPPVKNLEVDTRRKQQLQQLNTFKLIS